MVPLVAKYGTKSRRNCPFCLLAHKWTPKNYYFLTDFLSTQKSSLHIGCVPRLDFTVKMGTTLLCGYQCEVCSRRYFQTYFHYNHSRCMPDPAPCMSTDVLSTCTDTLALSVFWLVRTFLNVSLWLLYHLNSLNH